MTKKTNRNYSFEDKMLVTRQIVANRDGKVEPSAAYYNAYLLTNFGVVLDKPELITRDIVTAIGQVYKTTVPASLYKNPQDTKYYTVGELVLEQIVSYFLTYGAADSSENHVELFKKDLPQYCVGDELQLRTFKVLNAAEVDAELGQILANYCGYTRPWSLDEFEEVKYLVDNNFYTGDKVACGDNAGALLEYTEDGFYARFLYKKDLVKLSVKLFGDNKVMSKLPADKRALFATALPLAMDGPMSKKQAKYFNKLVSMCKVKAPKATNAQSADKYATAAIKAGDAVAATKIYADRGGAALTRHLKMLLSRAKTPEETSQILDLVAAGSPLATYQLISSLSMDNGAPRTFTFTRNGKVHKHLETDYETRWRKSRLSAKQTVMLEEVGRERIVEAYQTMPTIGKVYVDDAFYKIATPINTSATGKGIGVKPVGSRIPLEDTPYVRTFVYWKEACDIDSSLILVNNKGETTCVNFGNFAGYCRNQLQNAICFSGDCTAWTGAEYYDIDLKAMKALGFTKIIQGFHGFSSRLDRGDIHAGYQCKQNLKTVAWDPKNIAFQMHVKGDARACMSFAIDLESNEIVILNQIIDSESQVVNAAQMQNVLKYFSPDALLLNMGLIAASRATECVATPEEAEVVFADNYKPVEGQKVIQSFEIEKLVALANGQNI